jgi:hypothetical protein
MRGLTVDTTERRYPLSCAYEIDIRTSMQLTHDNSYCRSRTPTVHALVAASAEQHHAMRACNRIQQRCSRRTSLHMLGHRHTGLQLTMMRWSTATGCVKLPAAGASQARQATCAYLCTPPPVAAWLTLLTQGCHRTRSSSVTNLPSGMHMHQCTHNLAEPAQ